MKKINSKDYLFTPPDIFKEINDRFGPFDLDAAATPENAKCDRFYTESDDGLSQPWARRTFVNPPYSNVTPWLAKAKAEMERGNTTFMLLKYDHSTKWWRDYIQADYFPTQYHPGVTVFHWPRRIKFGVPEGTVNDKGELVKESTSPFPSVLIVFEGGE